MQFEKGKVPDGAVPFKPGQSGNRNGRPKSAISQYLREYGDAAELRISIEKVDPAGKLTRQEFSLSTCEQTINRTIAALMMMRSLSGDVRMIREVLNRTEGRVPRPIVIRGEENDGAELKAWSAEEVDRYEAWIARPDLIERFEAWLAEQEPAGLENQDE